MKLKPYGYCIKCGGDEISLEYIGATKYYKKEKALCDNVVTRLVETKSDESKLNCTCDRCGYKWVEDTLDKRDLQREIEYEKIYKGAYDFLVVKERKGEATKILQFMSNDDNQKGWYSILVVSENTPKDGIFKAAKKYKNNFNDDDLKKLLNEEEIYIPYSGRIRLVFPLDNGIIPYINF